MLKIVYTGLRHGEKMHEVPLGSGEAGHGTMYCAPISDLPVPPLNTPELGALWDAPAEEARCLVAAIASDNVPR